MLGGAAQMILSMAFNFLLMMLFAPKPKDTVTYGPRLDNLKPATKDIQGQVINLTYGTSRISGTVFWASNIRETVHKEETEYSSKGNSDYTHTDVTYTYDCDLAIGICEGPIVGIRKIWANKEVIYDIDQTPSTVSWLKYTIYEGTETQAPSTLMQAAIGYDLVSAHRGLAYIILEQFQLDPFGRRIPQSFEFEVVAKGTGQPGAYVYPQISTPKFGDVGNTQYFNIYGYYNSQYMNTIMQLDAYNRLFLVTGPDGLLYGKINQGNNSIQKYYVDVGDFGCDPWSSSYNLRGWGIGSSNFVYLRVTVGGTGYRHVPCIIVQTQVATGDSNYMAAFFAVNTINNRVIAKVLLPDCQLVGSFNQFYWSGIWNNSIGCMQSTDGYSRLYIAHDYVRNIAAEMPYSIDDVDSLGFVKHIKRSCLRWQNSDVSRVIVSGMGLNPYHVHLMGFPDENDPSSSDYYGNCWDQDTMEFLLYATYTIYSYEYEIVSVHIDHTRGVNTEEVIYENYKYSINDLLDHDKAGFVKVKKKKFQSDYWCYGQTLISTIPVEETTEYYPAIFGNVIATADMNPDPPVGEDTNIELASKVSIFVFYISDTDYVVLDGNVPTINKWIMMSNGESILSLSHKNLSGIIVNNVYRTNPFYEYMDLTYDEAIQFDVYKQYLGAAEKRKIFPGIKYDPPYYIPSSDFSLTSTVSFDVNSSNVAYNQNQFYKAAANVTIPSTAYWDKNLTKIYYMSGSNVFYYDILENTVNLMYDTGVSGIQNIIPAGGKDFIGTKFNGDNSGVFYLKHFLSRKSALLGEIITDLSIKAGINIDNIDISDEAYNIEVHGYNISDDMKLIDMLESLLMHYFIDAFESEWKIKYRTRKESIARGDTIPKIALNELGVHNIGEKYNQQYKIILREDTELPHSVNYAYITFENGYIQSNVTAIRNIDFGLGIKTSVKCPMVLKTTEAYNNAFRILFDIWRSVKEYEFRLPRSYEYLEPGDIVLLPIGTSKETNEYAVVKITEVVAATNSYLELLGVEEDARNLEGLINDGAFEPEVKTLVPLALSDGVMLDSPPLYNKFNNIDYNIPGIYYAIYGNNNYWRGGSAFISLDDVAYSEYAKFGPYSAAFGTVITATNYAVSKYYTDTINNITIQSDSIQDFYSVDDHDFNYMEGNLIAVYKYSDNSIEYMQFKNIDIDPDNPKFITLSNFKRGMYNSDITTISKNDKVALLPVGCGKLNIITDYYNKSISYKLVSFNQTLDNANTERFIYKCNWYNPYNVTNLRSEKVSSDINITWVSRERNKPPYLLHSPTQLDAKEYTIKIYNFDNTLVRTVGSITTDNYIYTNANIIADGLTLDSYIRFELQRKATFLEYNHTVVDEVAYIGNEVNLLQQISNNHLILYLESKNTDSINITPTYGTDGYQTITYNNYTNKGSITKNDCFYSLNSISPLKNEKLTLTSTNYDPAYTISFWVNINDTNAGYDNLYNYIVRTNLYGGPGTYDGPVKISVVSTHLGNTISFAGNASVNQIIPNNKWIFVCFTYSHLVSGRPFSYFFRSIDNSFNIQSGYNTNNANWGLANLYGSCELTTKICEDSNLKYSVQDLVIFDTDLYIDAGRSFDSVELLYNMGYKKWQQR